MTYKWDNKDLNPVPAITWNTPFMQQFWLLCVWAKWLSLPATGWTSGYFWVDRFTLLCHHLAKHVIVYGEFGKSIKTWSQPNFLLRPEVAWDEPGMGFLWAAQGYWVIFPVGAGRPSWGVREVWSCTRLGHFGSWYFVPLTSATQKLKTDPYKNQKTPFFPEITKNWNFLQI